MAEGPVDETLDVGGRLSAVAVRVAMFRAAHARGSRIVLGVLGVLAAVAAIVVVTLGVAGTRTPSTPAPTASVRNVADVPARPPPPQLAALRQVRALTERAVPLTDYVRPTAAAGACAQVEPGRSATTSVEHVLARTLPRFRVVAVGRTLDQFTGLCALQVRATASNGVVLGLVTTSPTAGDHAPAYLHTGHDSGLMRVTSYVQLRRRDGWTVLLGVTGPASAVPGTETLHRAAADRGLTW